MRSSLIRLLATLWLLPALAWAQQQAGAELNVISKVNVQGGTIEIVGSRKPSFTTFTMTDPPRLVIDVSEAVFSGVPDEMQVGNGVVTAVKTASYGTGDRAIARILVGFTKDVETDIQTQEGKLLVKVLGSAGAEPVAIGTPPAGNQQVATADQAGADAASQRAQQDDKAQQQAAAQSQKAAEEDRKRQEADAKEAARKAEADRIAQEKAAKEAARQAEADRIAQEKAAKDAARAAAEEEKKQKAEEAKAAAEEKKRQQEEARAAAEEEKKRKAEEVKAAAEEKKRTAEEARAAAEEEKKRKAEEARAAAAEKKRQAEEARAAAAEEKKRKAEEARTAAAEKKRQAEEARAAAAAEKKRKAEEARAAAEEKKRQQEEEKRRLAEEKANKGRKVAMADTGTASTEGGPPNVSPRRKTITFLGFKQEADGSRVFVRTNEPVRYSVSPGAKNSVVLRLENTRFGQANTRRPLDTSFFDTAVSKVTSDVSGQAARIEITLKQSVPYEAHQEGNEVFLEFPRPGRR